MRIDRVFLCVRHADGCRWLASLGEINHEQFEKWTTSWYALAGVPHEQLPPETSPGEREAVLLNMAKWKIAPAQIVKLPGEEAGVV